MDEPHKIDIEKYRYALEDDQVAKYPLARRDQSRLLYYQRGQISQHIFFELPRILSGESWLVFNNTRVIQARLKFTKSTGARIEIFCLEPADPPDYHQSFLSTGTCTWKCLVGNAKRWKAGPIALSGKINGQDVVLEASILKQEKEDFTILFTWNNPEITFGEILENTGSTPIPPYLHRDAEKSDRERYQTIYSLDPGSVAAPTAGLHFTREMVQQIRERGIPTAEITLHVGAGTFVPVREKDARDHAMHAEQVFVSLDFLNQWLDHPDGLIAVGTTSTRSMESLYWLGVKIIEGKEPDLSHLKLEQWENEALPQGITLAKSVAALIQYCRLHRLDHLRFSTRLMIVPGYRFRTISGLITNFHLPGSTLLLLIAAFIGEDWVKVYDFALKNHFRFLSYGDSSLLIPGGKLNL